MCTEARFVQGAQTSQWFGMPMPNAPVPAANMRLQPQPAAYVEVTIDPAAHGDAGLGPIQRAARLKTADGQEWTFELTAYVDR
jgi:hypothetical protein